MASYEYGERIARTARLITGTSAFILDGTGSKVLLTRRTDNGRWCLPGGAMEPGESAEEGCVREVWEETGLEVRITRLIGVYSNPHRITTYSDGNRWQVISLSFAAEIISGEPGLSNETTEIGFFTTAEIEQMDVIDPHRERITDAFSNQVAAYFK
jgi:ADP-ribose pyrophosphatase YjhB (NUDIX family)